MARKKCYYILWNVVILKNVLPWIPKHYISCLKYAIMPIGMFKKSPSKDQTVAFQKCVNTAEAFVDQSSNWLSLKSMIDDYNWLGWIWRQIRWANYDQRWRRTTMPTGSTTVTAMQSLGFAQFSLKESIMSVWFIGVYLHGPRKGGISSMAHIPIIIPPTHSEWPAQYASHRQHQE